MKHVYFKRRIDKDLLAWSNDTYRKPLLVRGARQVGKSSAIRRLGEQFEHYVEINFEEQKEIQKLFQSDLTPHILCDNLSVFLGVTIRPEKTLLFFDEIQACLPAIASLRFFYEQYPELHIIAAGSLLEFALAEIPSFGVGRVRSVFMYPFSFDEFLMAMDEDKLLHAKASASPDNPLLEPIHDKLIDYLKRFLIIGGMPEVISCYAQSNDLKACSDILEDLIVSFKVDFAKYKEKVSSPRIAEVFEGVVQQVGGRFMYAKAASHYNIQQVKQAVDMLIMSGLVIQNTHTAANGLPLGAETNHKKRKMLIIDTGLLHHILGLSISDSLFRDDFAAINKGAIAEMFVGLEIQKNSSCYRHDELYFWQREALNSSAEIDYVIQRDGAILPIEVKSGHSGSMQSMFIFLKEKGMDYGIRCSLENFCQYDNIKVYPLYAISNIL